MSDPHRHLLASAASTDIPDGMAEADRFLTGKQAHSALSRALNRPHIAPHTIDDCGYRIEPHAIVIAVTLHRNATYSQRHTYRVERTTHDTVHVRAMDYADLIHTEPLDPKS